MDLTFGEYLRALITADMDLMPEDKHGYRVAFIEAFRRRGIYPAGLRTLSQDSLRWSRPEEDPEFGPGEMERALEQFVAAVKLREHVDALRYKRDRREHWQESRTIRFKLHKAIREYVEKAVVLQKLTGLALTDEGANFPGVKLHKDGAPVFAVQAVRESRRLQDDGRTLNQVFITLLQKQELEHEGEKYPLRCGSTLVFDLDTQRVTCVIRKGLRDPERLTRTVKFEVEQAAGASLAPTYFRESREKRESRKRREPFAALHSSGA